MTVAMGRPSVKSASPPGHGKDKTQAPWPLLEALLQLRVVRGTPQVVLCPAAHQAGVPRKGPRPGSVL